MATDRISPIDQSNLRDSAYQALRDAFTQGQFAPGDVLSLRSLAEQLGISMTPVREAVRRLVAEGALIDTRSRTLCVPQFSLRRMADLKSARLALEKMLVEQAIPNITKKDIEQLKAVIAEPSPQDLAGPDLVKNYKFHFTLYRLSGSEVLLPMVEALWLQYGSYLNLIKRVQDFKEIADHSLHYLIIDALEAGDVKGAVNALEQDIERSFQFLRAEYSVSIASTQKA